jgi:AcrR family transcriptional regulator
MPKIIENVRYQLMAEAKKQIAELGYKNTTIRSVATGCNIAVGTVYNYFKSKDVLIASFILQDWLEVVNSISAYPKESRKDYIEYIHTSLIKFETNYTGLFSDKDAQTVFNLAFSERHKQLRNQLATLILPICRGDDMFLAEYVAEALLTWTMAGKSFKSIYALLPEQIK